MNDIEKRIEELTNELNYHNHKYYVDDAPEISDFAFDKMLVELEQLEEKYPEYKKKRRGGEPRRLQCLCLSVLIIFHRLQYLRRYILYVQFRRNL
mgnify:CR=1 FL=1